MTHSTETIAAIATPPGQGGIGVVRISGPRALDVAEALSGQRPLPGRVRYSRLHDGAGELIDDGLVLGFVAPASFTGEDVVEFQIHGGQFVLARLLDVLCREQGLRQARPGEFSERAFHNGKLDLAQAEAIADLIAAGSDQAARAAQRSLAGVFSRRCHELHEAMLDLRMRLEAAIDFPEEEIDFLSDPELQARWQTLHVEHEQLLLDTHHGVQLSQGLCVVLAGPPNAGKSSILNYLARREAAIVTPIAGTTRDLLSESLQLNGVPVTLIDTAGLRDSDDPVEREGVRRARAAIETADFVLHVQAPDVPDDEPPVSRARQIRVLNKCDLAEQGSGWLDDSHAAIRVSAKTGAGMELLVDELAGHAGAGGEFSARQRHLDALHRCGEHLDRAGQQLRLGAGDLAAEELRLAQQDLGEITGQVHSDDLLGRIFSSFCIGK